jgi:hypothetical protein
MVRSGGPKKACQLCVVIPLKRGREGRMKTNTYLEPSMYTISDVYNYFIFQNPLSS